MCNYEFKNLWEALDFDQGCLVWWLLFHVFSSLSPPFLSPFLNGDLLITGPLMRLFQGLPVHCKRGNTYKLCKGEDL